MIWIVRKLSGKILFLPIMSFPVIMIEIWKNYGGTMMPIVSRANVISVQYLLSEKELNDQWSSFFDYRFMSHSWKRFCWKNHELNWLLANSRLPSLICTHPFCIFKFHLALNAPSTHRGMDEKALISHLNYRWFCN